MPSPFSLLIRSLSSWLRLNFDGCSFRYLDQSGTIGCKSSNQQGMLFQSLKVSIWWTYASITENILFWRILKRLLMRWWLMWLLRRHPLSLSHVMRMRDLYLKTCHYFSALRKAISNTIVLYLDCAVLCSIFSSHFFFFFYSCFVLFFYIGSSEKIRDILKSGH